MAIMTDSQLKRVTDELKKQDLWLSKIGGTDKDFIEVATWGDVKNAVAKNVHTQVFDVWDSFTTTENSKSIEWEIVGFDKEACSDGSTNNIDLLSKYTIGGYQFDAPEALIGVPSGLTAGTYSFEVTAKVGNAVAGIYEITLPTLAEKTRLKPTANTETTITFTVYDKYGTAGSTYTASKVDATSYPSLGKNGVTSANATGCYLNHLDRINYGSNNYKESNIAWFLNHKGTDTWEAQTMFDMPASYLTSAGKKCMLDYIPSDMLEVLGTVSVKCHANSTYEAPDSTTPKDSNYVVQQKVFLTNWKALGGGYADGKDDGSLEYDAYAGASNSDRIKKNSASGSAQYWWIRDPYPSVASFEHFVSTTGTLDYGGAYGGYQLVPACVVYAS